MRPSPTRSGDGTAARPHKETTIATSTWSASDPAGLIIASSPAPSVFGTKTVVWVSGGTAGVRYTLTNTIVTGSEEPRTHQRTITIHCVQR